MAWCQIGNITVTSAASFQPGVPPAGSIGTIFCTGLAVRGVVGAAGVPLPWTLAGVTVSIGGAPAPLFAVADLGGYQQINFQVPLEAKGIPDTGGIQVVVGQNGVQGSATAKVADIAGKFFRIAGTQLGAFQHGGDYSLVTSEKPAKAGETIIGYATGLNPASPPVATGQPSPVTPLSYVPQLAGPGQSGDTTGLIINNSVVLPNRFPYYYSPDADLPFMGLTPGSVGLYQINFVLPQGLPSGNLPIRIRRWYCSPTTYDCGAPRGAGTQVLDGQNVLIPVQ
jgi:uncharacterized protein (TIGR03437 family)